jgi:hypothetical protein
MIAGWKRLIAEKIVSLAEFWATKDNVDNLVKANFEKAKAISDFVGMIVRFAFVVAATAFFFRRSQEVKGFGGYLLGVCATVASGLTVVFGYRIMMLVVAYEQRSTHAWKSTWARLIGFIFGVLMATSIWYGIVDIVKVLSSSLGAVK